MEQKTVIFFGRSGSGKGTQAKLLIEALKKEGTRDVLYIETGARIRKFIQENKTYASEITGAILADGALLPEFFPVWIWANILINDFSGNEHLVIDGASRRVGEAPILKSALEFFNVQNPHVVHINTSNDWSTARLMERGRSDDDEAEIRKRLGWFDKDVMPAVNFFKNDPYFNFLEVNGERSIDDVHRDILSFILA